MCKVTAMNSKQMHQSDDASILPEWFKPCDKDVICGWARQNHHHRKFRRQLSRLQADTKSQAHRPLSLAGNKRFRQLIDDFAPKYVEATTKLEKTQVIATVIDRVRADSPNGGFIKKDFYTGRWYEIGNEKARDKCGHAIRCESWCCGWSSFHCCQLLFPALRSNSVLLMYVLHSFFHLAPCTLP